MKWTPLEATDTMILTGNDDGRVTYCTPEFIDDLPSSMIGKPNILQLEGYSFEVADIENLTRVHPDPKDAKREIAVSKRAIEFNPYVMPEPSPHLVYCAFDAIRKTWYVRQPTALEQSLNDRLSNQAPHPR